MRIGPPLIPLFNEAARGDDIARVDHPSQVDQLANISNGRKMVIFKSVEETEQLLPDMAGEIDIIGYNLEHGQTTPAAEKEDPVRSIQRMRDLADEHGLQLAFGPDHDFALSNGVEIAPFVDIFVLQIQRQQTNPVTVEAFVVPLVPQLREANPDLEVSVQVRTEGDVEGIVELLDSLKPHLDGVSILTSPDTVGVAEELVVSLRPYVTMPSQGSDRTALYILLALLAVGLLGAFVLRRRRTAG
jgi:MYXO-CTERM domain-containing protein